MSEAVRVYSGSAASGRGRGRRRTPYVRWAVVAVVLICGVYALWISRNTHEAGAFVPADQRLQVVVVDPLVKREVLAASPVWEAMPPFTGLQRVPAMLRGLGNAPEWVLNNVVGEVCHVAANDTQAFSDLIVVTTMTRVGVWIERLSRMRGGVDHDEAGGLDLRRLSGQEMYYAVRGRTLVASRSREALIRALTLRPAEAVSAAAEARPMGGEDLSGTIRLAESDALGLVFASMSFAVVVQDTTLRVAFRGVPTAFWQQQLTSLAPGLGPQPLPAPPEGMVTAALNVGLPVRDTWALLGATGLPVFSADQWDSWRTLDSGEAPGLAYVLTALAGDLGPGVGRSLRRVDIDAMFPTPEFALVFEASEADLTAAYAALPKAPDARAAGFPRVDPETRQVSYPLLGDPVLEPTVAPYGPGLLVSSSRPLAEDLLATSPQAQQPAIEGNLYVRILPGPCVAAAVEVGRLLAESGLLKGYDPVSFEAAAGQWMEAASGIRDVTLTAACIEGEISGEFRVETAGR